MTDPTEQKWAALLQVIRNGRAKALFVTMEPDRYTPGEVWRNFRVVAVEPIVEQPGAFVVRGSRVW